MQSGKRIPNAIAERSKKMLEMLKNGSSEQSIFREFEVWSEQEREALHLTHHSAIIQAAVKQKNPEYASRYYNLLKFRFGIRKVPKPLYHQLFNFFYQNKNYESAISVYHDLNLLQDTSQVKLNWNHLFIAMVQAKQFSFAKLLYDQHGTSMTRNVEFLTSYILALCAWKSFDIGQVMEEYVQQGGKQETFLYHHAFRAWMDMEEYELLMKVFLQNPKLKRQPFSCNCVLQAYVYVGKLDEAMKMFEWIKNLKSKFFMSASIPSLVDLFVKKFGLKDGISLVLDELTKLLGSKYPSELYFAMIVQYAKACEIQQMELWIQKARKSQISIMNSQTMDGIANAYVLARDSNKLFLAFKRWIYHKNMTMDQVAIILKAFLELGDLKRCRNVISEFNAAELESNPKTLAMLVDVYGRETRFKEMEQSFEELKSIDPDSEQIDYASSAVIEAYSLANKSVKMADVLEFKTHEGLKLSERDYASLLQLQKTQQDWKAVQDTIRKYQSDYPQLTNLNLNTLILSYYGEHQYIQEMMDFYEQLLNLRLSITDEYYAVILSSIVHAEYTKLAIQMVQQTPKNLINLPKSRIWNSLFKAVMERSNVPLAFTMLHEIQKIGQKIGVEIYTLLIKECGKLGKWEEMEDIADQMVRSGIEHNANTITAMINGYGRSKQVDKLFTSLETMEERGLQGNIGTSNAIAIALGNSGDLQALISYVNLLRQRKTINFSTYAILLGALSRQKKFFDIEILYKLIKNEYKVHESFYVIVIDAFGQAASSDSFWCSSLDSVVKDYFSAHNNEFKHVPVLGATIKAYSYAKQFQKAYQLWKSHAEKLPKPLDSQLLTVAIDAAGFAQNRDWIKELLEFLDTPSGNQNTYITFIEALCRVGDYRRAIAIFSQFFDRFDHILDESKLRGTFLNGIRSSGDQLLVNEANHLCNNLFHAYHQRQQL
jgi:pentatricopeptide repeat protein